MAEVEVCYLHSATLLPFKAGGGSSPGTPTLCVCVLFTPVFIFG